MKCFLMSLLVCFCSCSRYSNNNINDLIASDYCVMLRTIENKYISDMKHKYNAVLAGIGGRMMYEIQDIYLNFHMTRIVDKGEARKIYIDFVSELLARINEDDQIRPHLSHSPYTAKGVSLQLIFFREENVRPLPKNIAIVSMYKGYISYSIWDTSTNVYKEIYEETYDEAIQIVNSPCSF